MVAAPAPLTLDRPKRGGPGVRLRKRPPRKGWSRHRGRRHEIIRRVEVVDGEIPVTLVNEAAIRHILTPLAFEFIEGNGTGEGVQFASRDTHDESSVWHQCRSPSSGLHMASLRAAGVEFIDENGGGPGVRMRKRPQRKG